MQNAHLNCPLSRQRSFTDMTICTNKVEQVCFCFCFSKNIFRKIYRKVLEYLLMVKVKKSLFLYK